MKSKFCLSEHITRTILEGLQECFACGAELKIIDFKDLCSSCWRRSGGGIFDKNLKVDVSEWESRRKHLETGGEVDFGVNWKFIDYRPKMELELPKSFRASVRLNKEQNKYEAYGMVYDPRGYYEISLFLSNDIRQAYRAAVLAGPYSRVLVKMIQKETQKHHHQHNRNHSKNQNIREKFFDHPFLPGSTKVIDKEGVCLVLYYNFKFNND